MATLTSTNIITYGDWLKAIGPDQRIMAVVALLNANNTVMQDMSYVEGNGIAANLTTQQSVLAGNTWRDINAATLPTKSLTNQVWDVAASLEAWCSLDTKLWELQGDGNKFRALQDRARLESMSQDMAAGVFYSNNDQYPKRFHGLTPRYNTTTGDFASQVLLAGGSGSDNTSIWVVDWDESTISGFYPKGSKAGFQYKDYGDQAIGDNTNGFQSVLLSKYMWDMGLYVADYRYAARLCNIDVSVIAGGADISGLGGLVKGLIRLCNSLPQQKRGNRVMYMNQNTLTALECLSVGSTNVTGWNSNVRLTLDNFAGKQCQFFRDIPIRVADAILEDEDLVA